MLQRIRSNNLTTIRIRLRGGRRLAGLIQGRKRTQLIGATFAALLGCITFHPSTAQGQDAPSIVGSSPLYSLSGATGWINSKPLTANDLKGKVVLVDFWDYSCINCIRAIPYIRTWADKYKDSGLVVIGVHTPEFRATCSFSAAASSNANERRAYSASHPIDLFTQRRTRRRSSADFSVTKGLIRIPVREIYLIDCKRLISVSCPQGTTGIANKKDTMVFHILPHIVPHKPNKNSYPDFLRTF